MRTQPIIVTLVAGLMIIAGVVSFAPFVFADRTMPGLKIGDYDISGIAFKDLPGVIRQYESILDQRKITVTLRQVTKEYPLAQLGIHLDLAKTVDRIIAAQQSPRRSIDLVVAPQFMIDQKQLNQTIEQDFVSEMTLPQNADLKVSPNYTIVSTPSKIGEGTDTVSLTEDIAWLAKHQAWSNIVELKVITQPPRVHEGEVLAAKAYAQQLLKTGLTLKSGENTWTLLPYTIFRLIQFEEINDPAIAGNTILGVTLDRQGLKDYLTTTIAPDITQPAINARFARVGQRVDQFAIPQAGRELNIPLSEDLIIAAVNRGSAIADLAVTVTEPAVRNITDIESLGLTSLLASGESDFKGSTANRIKNITVGTQLYHGLLIPPGEEFSFDKYLGPVDASHGFTPELVIKNNQTTPEYGGGLCQVSTTIFRAAVKSGLEITQRRNHAYAVSYYGTPGFDATIYPPYTDLRFINNTPEYILIQARIEGTKLTFEFWGTNDGRQTEVVGPTPYGRQPDGAVKAVLEQKVTKGGEVMLEDKFYSNYRSPKLYPRVLAVEDRPVTDVPSVVDQNTTLPLTNDNPTPVPTNRPAQAAPNQATASAAPE